MLGLPGQVKPGHFKRMISGLDPHSGERLIQQLRKDRVPGVEFCFSAPKSVSLIHAYTGDTRIVEALRDAVARTMASIEQGMQTRVRKNGQGEDRVTGNIAWAEFIHETARPVAGTADPLLHIHAFVPNVTFDFVEKKWKSAQFFETRCRANDYQAEFLNHLAGNMTALGYEVTWRGKWWDIAGISRNTVARHSQRTQQIESEAQRLGVTDQAAIASLASKTRDPKPKLVGGIDYRERWRDRLSIVEAQEIRRVVERAEGQTDGDGNAFHGRHHFWDLSAIERLDALDSIEDQHQARSSGLPSGEAFQIAYQGKLEGQGRARH